MTFFYTCIEIANKDKVLIISIILINEYRNLIFVWIISEIKPWTVKSGHGPFTEKNLRQQCLTESAQGTHPRSPLGLAQLG